MKTFLRIVLVAWFVAINAYGYLEMEKDKRIAERNEGKSNDLREWRTSERELLRNAYIGGAIGVGAGMIKFRHKIAADKENFTQTIPYLMFGELALFFLVYVMLGQKKE